MLLAVSLRSADMRRAASSTIRPGARLIRLGLGRLVRLAPGGTSLLRLRRRGVAVARRRMRPIRPPAPSAEAVASLPIADAHPFITGNGVAARCRYVINYDDVVVNENVDNDWWFCRTDFIEHFFARREPKHDYLLFSHNSDRPVDDRLRRFLRRRRLRAWFAVNVATVHPKLRAFPLGIANSRWPHGDGAALLRVQAERVEKTRLFDASYDVSTARPVREYCLAQTGIEPGPRREFEDYLRGLAAARFCIAPSGNGIDTHRLWEALYLRTVPVVTRSALTEQHGDLPLVVLDDWADFRSIDFSPELYRRVIGSWSPDSLLLGRYMERLGKVVAGAGTADLRR